MPGVVSSLAYQTKAIAHFHLMPPKRATLAKPNERRPAAWYQALFFTLYARCQVAAPGHRFRFKSPLFSLDSTTISLCLKLFPWARFLRAKGAIKLHTLLDHAGHIHACMVLTEGKRSDFAVARGLQLPKGSIVAMDRGDIDDGFLLRLTKDSVSFVTRQKVNARVKVRERFEVNWHRGLTSDHNVILRGQKANAYPAVLRRVGYRDQETGKHYVFWTNAFHLLRLKALVCGLALAGAFLVTGGFVEAATYYVATDGRDGNTCAEAQNSSTAKLTIAQGITCLSSGDTLIIKGGTYNEVLFNPPSGNSSAAMTSVKGAPGEIVVLKPDRADVIIAFDARRSYISIENLTVDGNNKSSWYGVWLTGSHNRLQDLTFRYLGLEAREVSLPPAHKSPRGPGGSSCTDLSLPCS